MLEFQGDFWGGGTDIQSEQGDIYTECLLYLNKVCMFAMNIQSIILKSIGICFHFSKLGMKCSNLNV